MTAAAHSTMDSLRRRDCLAISDFSTKELRAILDSAHAFKKDRARFADVLAGITGVLVFEKPSLRTRISFEVALTSLGGHAIYYDASNARLGVRESTHDYAKNLERFCGVIVARVFKQQVLNELAHHAGVPVINALSEVAHPCQALADLLTIEEWARRNDKALSDVTVAYIGDGNNVCRSLMVAAAKVGCSFVFVGPEGFEPPADAVQQAEREAALHGTKVVISNDLGAIVGADVVYADTWVSMGDEAKQKDLERAFAGYQVGEAVMKNAADGAIFMHCMPAHRGVEVTDAVMDSDASVVFDQAENRLHAQAGLLIELFADA